MKAIFKREVKSYFTGMIGWVVAAVSLFFLGLYYTNRNLLYASSDFASVLYTMTMILLFLLPAISMRSFAEERKNRTDQLLLTSPVSIPAIVAGKFLAEVAVFALPLAAAVLMPLILKAFGTVSLVAAYSAVLGYLLLGSACLAVGTWISALTENQILAYLATFGALLVAYIMDGIQTMVKIRENSNVPVIFLTAKSEDNDKVLGLMVGADDYITKPFNPVEVQARVKSQLRRYMQLGGGNMTKKNLAIGGIELDDSAKVVTLDGDAVSLTPTEYDILKLFMEQPGVVFSPKDIYRKVWKDAPFGSESTVAVHIRHLREKLEYDPANPRYLKVVWGQGYKMERGNTP